MNNLKILIVEGNPKEENESFSKAGIKTHTESLKESLNYFTSEINFEVINPSSDQNISRIISKLHTYDGLIWGGSSLNIYNNTPEIKKQIEFMKECQKKVRNILAICWGLQVAVTAAEGEVKKANNFNIGISEDIIINKVGVKHSIYKNKSNNFNTPAFNFDEVTKLPKNSICLASNINNKIQSLYFETSNSKIYGLQYHPEITYEKMISLIEFRKEKLISNRKAFKNDQEVQNHIKFIKKEVDKSNDDQRMIELKNWIDFIKN